MKAIPDTDPAPALHKKVKNIKYDLKLADLKQNSSAKPFPFLYFTKSRLKKNSIKISNATFTPGARAGADSGA